MDDGAVRREACRPRKVSSSELLGANGLQDGEAVSAPFSREAHLLPAGGLSAAARRAERRNSAPQVVHQRHMPMEPKKFQIPKKTKEQRGGSGTASVRVYVDRWTLGRFWFRAENTLLCGVGTQWAGVLRWSHHFSQTEV